MLDDERYLEAYKPSKILRLVLFHAMLGPVFMSLPALATLHAAAVGLISLYIVLNEKRSHRFMLMMGYVAGCEVLWRMTHATIPWMFAEYLSLLMIVFGLMRLPGTRKTLFLPLYYVLSLTPSVILTFFSKSIGEAREDVVFNLLGPITIGFGMFAVSRLRFDARSLNKAMLFSAFPVAGIVMITIVAVYIQGVSYNAVSESNSAAAGGYSPNQVSSAISFAATMLLLLTFLAPEYSKSRKLFGAMIVVYVVQMVLTLSRGGVMNFLVFALIGLPFFMQTKQGRVRLIFGIILVIVLMWTVVLPALDTFTAGAISRRYEDQSTTHRTSIMEEELQAFSKSPIIGVGPGDADVYRFVEGNVTVQSHTEYTRVLAEHGAVGAIGLLLLAIAFTILFFRSDTIVKKGVSLGAASWVFIYFSHSASRIVAFAYIGLFAVAYAGTYRPESESE